MTFFQVILESLIIFGINTIFGSALFLILRSYLRSRVEEWLQNTISDYIREQLTITLQNPSETAKALKPIIIAIMNEISKDFQSEQKEPTVKLPFLGKVPLSILQMFLERFLSGSSNQKRESGNPFA